MDPIKRRTFVKKAGLAAAGMTTGLAAAPVNKGNPAIKANPLINTDKKKDPWRIHFFSKHLQFLDYHGAAEACAEVGMDGADLTVRPGGHVLPEHVERDLPLAVKAFQNAGLQIEMMTSGITDPDDPLTEKVLQTASGLGIRFYRLGYYKYAPALSVEDNLERIKGQMTGLARLNEKYQIHGAYQNHAGSNFGAPVWDLWTVIKDMDPRWTGCQYDVRHATVEGNRSWPLGLKLLKNHIRCMVSKDFRWGEEDGKAREVNVPIGEGMVDFFAYFELVQELGIRGPITLHLEYPMFPNSEMTRQEMKARAIQLMQKDLDALKKYL
jgi:L-ribulose-5-phosphate 3-epimerase